MRVLHVLNQLRASGAEVMLETAVPYWRADGVESEVLETSDTRGEYGQQLERAGFRVRWLPLHAAPTGLADLSRLIRSERFDVVHVHRERAELAICLAAHAGGPGAVVRTVHHIFPYTGLKRRRKIAERALNRRFGTVYVCNSLSGSANERERLRNPHHLAYNWFDEHAFVPPCQEERDRVRAALGFGEETVFVTLGGCAQYKNHDIVLRALVDVPGARYLHVGREPTGAERQLAGELGIADRVHFAGVVPDAREMLHAADVYLMPSTIEGFGVAAIEAMGTGLPAVLSDRPALKDLAGQVPGSWLPLEVDAWVAEMRRLAAMSHQERRDLGAAASGAVASRFGAAVGARRYAEVWASALGTA